MSNFKSPADAPFQIKTEGETISISFKSGIPANGQGTVQWNIPVPAQGCDSDRGVYCGMVVLLSDKPLTAENIPQNETYYIADPTASADMHVGDKIGNAYVIGAFYEGDIINQGGTPTTSFIVNDLKPNTPYYVAGYAADCQGRYHRDGVRAYSDLYAGTEEQGSSSFQEVILNNGNGHLPTDGTGLLPGVLYEFEFQMDPTFPAGTDLKTIKFSVDGINASTYEALLNEINAALALAGNPMQSPVPPNSGRYYWDQIAQQLSQWDGDSHEPVSGVIVEPTDPAIQATGDFWFDGNLLQQWDTPSAGVWNTVPYVPYSEDIKNLTSGDDFWFNGTNGYRWCSTTWCQEKTYNQEMDPLIIAPLTDCGHYWFDTVNSILFHWDIDVEQWVEEFALTWDSAPTTLAVGTHWFDLDTNSLFLREAGSVWAEIIPSNEVTLPTELRVIISTTIPTAPVQNLYWYNPDTEVLGLWNTTTMVFDDVPVLVWEGDPTIIETCDIWWNSTDDSLHKWDIVNSEWDPIANFNIAAVDPLTPPIVAFGELWHVPSTEMMYRFDGVSWKAVTHIEYPTDPTLLGVGEAWFNTTTSTWNIWGTPTASQWNVVETIDTSTDPTAIPSGTLWFNTTTTALYERIGAAWVVLPYSTIPFTPKKGEQWFDTSTKELKTWDGTQWVDLMPLARAFLSRTGQLIFQSAFTGSTACVMILVPEGAKSPVNPSRVATGTAGHDFYNYGIFENVPVSVTTVSPDTFLFDYLEGAYITRQQYGIDHADPVPSYDVLGVGDDGSPDERRNLKDRVMQQLGYPTVDVELTPGQLDIAVDLALSELRERSSAAYKRGFFFLDTQPRQQKYVLADKTTGFNTIVTVMGAYRMTSAFLSSAHGAGVYGQVVLQHLYNMGTFDLLSFHLISQYVEQMEHLFATRLTYHFHEATRELQFFQSFSLQERILLDVTCERTEQEILKDRWTRNWIERYTMAESMRMLSQVRGKFASLPGAGGGVSLNAADLMSQHDQIKLECQDDIDNYIVNDVEDIGLESTLIIG